MEKKKNLNITHYEQARDSLSSRNESCESVEDSDDSEEELDPDDE